MVSGVAMKPSKAKGKAKGKAKKKSGAEADEADETDKGYEVDFEGLSPEMRAVMQEAATCRREIEMMQPDKLKLVRSWRVGEGDEAAGLDGFQRALGKKKVDNIRTLAAQGFPFPPIMVARTWVDQGKHVDYYIDGQHRGEGHLLANKPLGALIVYANPDTVGRWLFLLHNGQMTKVKRKHMMAVSRNKTAQTVRALADEFGASADQLTWLFNGIVSGIAARGLNLLDLDAEIDPKHLALARECLELWTDSPLFTCLTSAPPKRTMASLYSGYATMQVVGVMAKENADRPEQRRDELTKLKNTNWEPRMALAKAYASNQSGIIAMLRVINDKILRGRVKPKPEVHKWS